MRRPGDVPLAVGAVLALAACSPDSGAQQRTATQASREGAAVTPADPVVDVETSRGGVPAEAVMDNAAGDEPNAGAANGS